MCIYLFIVSFLCMSTLMQQHTHYRMHVGRGRRQYVRIMSPFMISYFMTLIKRMKRNCETGFLTESGTSNAN